MSIPPSPERGHPTFVGGGPSRGRFKPVRRPAPLVSATLLLAVSIAAHGTERLVFGLDVRDGLPASRVLALAQDQRGFVWIGTQAGLARYDGTAVRPWAAERVTRVNVLAAGNGSVIAGWRGAAVTEIVGEEARPLRGPDGTPAKHFEDAAFDETGRLWLVSARRVSVRETDGSWTVIPGATLQGEVPWRIEIAGGFPYVQTGSGLWRFENGDAERVASLTDVAAFEILDDGTIWAAEFCCRIIEVRDGVSRVHLDVTDRSPLRAISMTARGGAVWVSYDQLLVRIGTDGRASLLDARDGIRGGGPLLVDREGSLWIGTNLGVERYPEPDTVMWTADDGLPRSFRHLAHNGEGIWVSGWDGIGHVDIDESRPVASKALDLMATYPLCEDGDGDLWIGGLLEPYGPGRENAIVELADRRVSVHEYPELGHAIATSACAEADDGTVWIALGAILTRTVRDDGPPARVARLVDGSANRFLAPQQIAHDSSGVLWLSSGERVCRARPDELLSDDVASISCETPDGAGEIFALLEAAAGEIWIATRDAGVLARRDGAWQPALSDGDLSTRWVQALSAARGGGVWVLADGLVGRAVLGDAGWTITERLGSWSGLPVLQARGAVESDDGTLWLASYAGIVRIPLSARLAAPEAPRVEIVSVMADDRRLDDMAGIELPYSRNRIELRYAALSFRDPERIVYRIRHRSDAPWSTTRDTALRFVDLAPGRYRIEVQASLDGRSWSADPALFVFVVSRPWYAQAWFVALAALAIMLALYSAYRIRMAYLLGIERERSRIAMDLHDDMGSKLGSIGLLADLATDADLAETRRRALTGRISSLASDVGGSLADIVWALRPGSMTLDALATHLAERGEELLSPRGIALETAFPERWPHVRLGLGVRRHVQLIGLEALHNASRHSGASRVRLSLVPADGRRWRLSVEDDGPGGARGNGAARSASPAPSRSGGVGLDSMRRRAALVGARLDCAPGDDGGWRVKLLFDPGAEDRRLGRAGRLPRSWGTSRRSDEAD